MEQRRIKSEGPFEIVHRNRWKVALARRHSTSCSVGSACVSGATKTFVTVTGDYYPCERVPRSEALCIGNVDTGINEEKVYRLLKEFVEATAEDCERCWCLPICLPTCHAMVRSKDGYTLAAKKEDCGFIKKRMYGA